MKWLKIKIKDYDTLNFPDACPNCLSSPSNQIVRIEKIIHAHFVNITYSIDWPHCQTCADFFKKRGELWKIYSIYILIALGIVVVGLALLATTFAFGGLGFIYAAIAFSVLSLLIYLKYRKVVSVMPLKTGHIRKGDVVKIHCNGKSVFSGKNFLTISLLNPQYAKLFLEKNVSLNLKYNPRTLKSALDLLELSKISPNL